MQRLQMAKNSLLLTALALAAVTAFSSFASAQTSSCTSAALSLAPCLSYITGNASTPSLPCCSQLSVLVQSQPECLCSLLNGGASSMGITLNQTRALALPGACNVQTPPLSSCNATAPGGPAKPPSTSPAAPKSPPAPAPEPPSPPESPSAPEAPRSSPPATPSTPPSVSGTGGGSTNSTAGQNSGGNSYYMYSSSWLLVAVLSAVAAVLPIH